MTGRRASVILIAGFLVSSCGGGSAPAAGAPGKGPVVAGEKFTVRQIPDPQQGGLVVGVVVVPESWRYESQVVWNYEHISLPVIFSSSAQNPANAEAVFAYPIQGYYYLRPRSPYVKPGEASGGITFSEARPPLDVLVSFIKKTRAGAAKLTFVGSKDLPDLPAALKIPPATNQHGLGVKVTYELDGQPVDEEFYAVSYSVDIPYDGPQGRSWQTNWGLMGLHSFRAPRETLDKRRPVFAAIAKSFRPNPAWEQRVAAINKYLTDEWNRQLQAGYDRIAAAGRLSKQISANNDAMIAAIDHQLQASSTARAPEAQSAAAKFDDYIRGVDTTNDPYYGTSQHSTNEQFHWTDGYGNYRNTNDTTYDPNRTEVGNWQLMKNIR